MSVSHAPGVDDFVNELLGEPTPDAAPESTEQADKMSNQTAAPAQANTPVDPVEKPAPVPATVSESDLKTVTDAEPPPAGLPSAPDNKPAPQQQATAPEPGPAPSTQPGPAAASAVAPPIDLDDWMQPASHPAEEQLHAPLLRCVSFRLQGQLYAAPVDSLLEVLSRAEIVPIPSKGYPVLGILNLRGSIVTVIDPAGLLALPPATDTQGRLIVVDYASEPVALRVDEVLEVVSLDESELQPPPENARHVQGLIESGDDMLTLLDLKMLVARAFGRV